MGGAGFGTRARRTIAAVAADVLDPEAALTEEEILSEGLLVEDAPRIVIPKKGKLFEEDGTCRVSVIRPCVSRGKRLRGLPPIYTPQMLAENAGVFTGWLMYMDHLTEAIVQALQERGRSIRELGGRVVQSYYDPEMVFEDDEEYGYRKGGVAARVLPQPAVRSMIEADPEILHCSINAYPRAVKPGVAPWDPKLKGMLVEGIRNKPPGSVDWVPRGGAGGRVLQETEQQMIGLLESFYGDAVSNLTPGYASGRGDEDTMNFKGMTKQQLAEHLRKENPELAAALNLTEGEADPTAVPPAAEPVREGQGMSRADVEALLAQHDATWEARLTEAESSVEERAAEIVEEREQARVLEGVAHRMIKRSGLPAGWQADLLRRYAVLPSGPTPALDAEPMTITEGEGTVDLSAEQVIERRVEADLKHAAELLAESGGRRARVTGLGGKAGNETNGGGKATAAHSAFRDFLRESGDRLEGDDKLDLKTMVKEGVAA